MLICGSGAGACVAANKFQRHPRGHLPRHVFRSPGSGGRRHERAVPGRARHRPELAAELVRTYLNAQFSDLERHRRRVSKVEQFEEEFGAERPPPPPAS